MLHNSHLKQKRNRTRMKLYLLHCRSAEHRARATASQSQYLQANTVWVSINETEERIRDVSFDEDT